MKQPDLHIQFKLAPWRIEAKVSPFTPWLQVEGASTIEGAVEREKELKASRHYYLTRVRTNL